MTTYEAFQSTALGAFLAGRGVEKGAPCALTGMGQIRGRWMVDDTDYPAFLDHLHNHLFVKHLAPIGLVEQRRTDGYSPLLVDLDFRYAPASAIERHFTISNIHQFIRTFVEQLNFFYDLSTHAPLRFFICLRPVPYRDMKAKAAERQVKDGVHIECPDLVLHTDHQQVIRQRMLELGSIGEAFGSTSYINDEKDIYDEAIAKKNGWLFYGESKPEIPAYSLKGVYTYIPKTGAYKEEKVEKYTSRQLLQLLSVRYEVEPEGLAIRPEAESEWARYNTAAHAKPEPVAAPAAGGAGAPAAAPQETVISLPAWFVTGCTEDEVALARELAVRCLSSERADGYVSWMEVGWCLRNIDSSEEMFDVWMEFSGKSGKSGGNNIAQLRREWIGGWVRYENARRFTIRSLHYWAKQDNPAEYKKIIEGNIIQFIETKLDATHTHIARLLHRLYSNDYKASVTSKTTEWYGFRDNTWDVIPQGIEIKNKMITEVVDLIDKAKHNIRHRWSEAKGDEEDFYKACLKRLTTIESKLYSHDFKTSVLKESVGLFAEMEFMQKLNSNPYLLGVANGVINLRAERLAADGSTEYYVEHRAGKPEDMVSFQAGRWLPKGCDAIPYVPYDPADPMQAEIDDFMSKVFPRADLRAYMWRKLASCLEGTNREQKYDTWIGVGGNGKSKLVDLMSITLGDYATSLQSTVLTRKRPDSGAANPEIMALRNRRFIYMAEPDDGEPLNTSRMKQFTGEDVVEARGLFEDQSKFQITGKMFMLCNKFPAIHTMDRGTWRRVMAVPFESKFVSPEGEEAKEIDPKKNVYPRDNGLDNKLKRWRVAFLSRLVYIYEKEYLKGGIEPIPAIVKQESDNYRALFDSFGKFKQARIRQEAGSESTLRDVIRVYKNWFEAMAGAGGKRLTQAELQKRLDEEFGVPADKKTYKRVRIFDTDEELEEWESEKSGSSAAAIPGGL
jgi:P4 family phage/plasmid primase-like protien